MKTAARRTHQGKRDIRHHKAYFYQIARHLLYHHYKAGTQQAVIAEIDTEELACRVLEIADEVGLSVAMEKILGTKIGTLSQAPGVVC